MPATERGSVAGPGGSRIMPDRNEGPTYYDDNFGHWEGMDDPDMVKFYHRTQDTNVLKQCRGCGSMVKIQPNYAYCNSCAEILERGGDLPSSWKNDMDDEHEDADDEIMEDDEDDAPTPPDPCAVCDGIGEDCCCEEGSTDAAGEPNFCYDCGRHIKDCRCHHGDEGPAYGY